MFKNLKISLSAKDETIVSLKLSRFNGQYVSTEAIASFTETIDHAVNTII